MRNIFDFLAPVPSELAHVLFAFVSSPCSPSPTTRGVEARGLGLAASIAGSESAPAGGGGFARVFFFALPPKHPPKHPPPPSGDSGASFCSIAARSAISAAAFSTAGLSGADRRMLMLIAGRGLRGILRVFENAATRYGAFREGDMLAIISILRSRTSFLDGVDSSFFAACSSATSASARASIASFTFAALSATE